MSMVIIKTVSAAVTVVEDGRPLQLNNTGAHASIAGQVAACLFGDVDFD
jgi:hypothetical protein